MTGEMEQNKEVVRAMLKALERQDLASLEEHLRIPQKSGHKKFTI